MTKPSTSRAADVSVFTAKKSISARSSLVKCRYQRSPGRHLAGQLYELRSWLRRSGGKNSATSRQSVWPKSVTYVAGTFYYLCVRAGPELFGGEGGIRTHGRISPTHAFQACSLNRSDTSPHASRAMNLINLAESSRRCTDRHQSLCTKISPRFRIRNYYAIFFSPHRDRALLTTVALC